MSDENILSDYYIVNPKNSFKNYIIIFIRRFFLVQRVDFSQFSSTINRRKCDFLEKKFAKSLHDSKIMLTFAAKSVKMTDKSRKNYYWGRKD